MQENDIPHIPAASLAWLDLPPRELLGAGRGRSRARCCLTIMKSLSCYNIIHPLIMQMKWAAGNRGPETES